MYKRVSRSKSRWILFANRPGGPWDIGYDLIMALFERWVGEMNLSIAPVSRVPWIDRRNVLFEIDGKSITAMVRTSLCFRLQIGEPEAVLLVECLKQGAWYCQKVVGNCQIPRRIWPKMLAEVVTISIISWSSSSADRTIPLAQISELEAKSLAKEIFRKCPSWQRQVEALVIIMSLLQGDGIFVTPDHFIKNQMYRHGLEYSMF